jgi:hypothetical protein
MPTARMAASDEILIVVAVVDVVDVAAGEAQGGRRWRLSSRALNESVQS